MNLATYFRCGTFATCRLDTTPAVNGEYRTGNRPNIRRSLPHWRRGNCILRHAENRRPFANHCAGPWQQRTLRRRGSRPSGRDRTIVRIFRWGRAAPARWSRPPSTRSSPPPLAVGRRTDPSSGGVGAPGTAPPSAPDAVDLPVSCRGVALRVNRLSNDHWSSARLPLFCQYDKLEPWLNTLNGFSKVTSPAILPFSSPPRSNSPSTSKPPRHSALLCHSH
jgi:hypothetical protein